MEGVEVECEGVVVEGRVVDLRSRPYCPFLVSLPSPLVVLAVAVVVPAAAAAAAAVCTEEDAEVSFRSAVATVVEVVSRDEGLE